MTPLEALRWAWGALTVLGLLGTLWHVGVALRALALCRWAAGRVLTWDDREAIAGRRRNALYRLAIKALLTAFAAACWAIFTGQDIARGWALVGVATALYGAALLLMTVWSWHAWTAARRRRPGG